MSIFSKLIDKVLGKQDKGTAIPGAMGDLLAKMGIHEIGPHIRSGTPISVLAGCKKAVMLVPGASKPAFKKNGEPLMAKTKASQGGRPYQVMDNYGISPKRWKQMQRDQHRKAAGLSYSGEPAADRDIRRAKMVAA